MSEAHERTAAEWLMLLHNRANRLATLVGLAAPEILIESGLELLAEARDGWRQTNGHDWADMSQQRLMAKKGPISKEDGYFLKSILADDGVTREEVRAALIREGLSETDADEVLG